MKSPVAQALTPVALGVLFLAVLGAGLWGAAWWFSKSKAAEVRIRSTNFDTLFYEREAKRITEKGPQLYPGLIGKDNGYIFVNHLGEDPNKGWYAFSALREGQPSKCTVVWKIVEKVFEDPCDLKQYPATGEGLKQFEAIPNQNTKHLVIDLTPNP